MTDGITIRTAKLEIGSPRIRNEDLCGRAARARRI
jgi:hypothetical protein